MTLTFFGHRNTPSNIQPKLRKVLEYLILYENANVFYIGNQGKFDLIAKNTLKQLKIQFPSIHYEIILAYMPTTHKEFDDTDYSKTVFPEELSNIPRRYAILKRNEYMLKKAETVITYVTEPVGGAAQFKIRAEKMGKRVINLPDIIA
ncbi:MAG: hypothetical protein ACI4W6_06110 [Acutalibacteraceae bacterium]